MAILPGLGVHSLMLPSQPVGSGSSQWMLARGLWNFGHARRKQRMYTPGMACSQFRSYSVRPSSIGRIKEETIFMKHEIVTEERKPGSHSASVTNERLEKPIRTIDWLLPFASFFSSSPGPCLSALAASRKGHDAMWGPSPGTRRDCGTGLRFPCIFARSVCNGELEIQMMADARLRAT